MTDYFKQNHKCLIFIKMLNGILHSYGLYVNNYSCTIGNEIKHVFHVEKKFINFPTILYYEMIHILWFKLLTLQSFAIDLIQTLTKEHKFDVILTVDSGGLFVM